MNFSYENQGTTTYLVYKIEENDEIDTMALGMMTNNRINGLASVIFTQMNEDRFLKYNVSSKISVRQFFMGTVNRKRLLSVFSGIVNVLLLVEDYMIEPASIILDLDYIFIDVSTCETVVICFPIVEEQKNKIDLGMFFKNIIFSTQFDQMENCDYVASLINYLNRAQVFSLVGFKEVLDGLLENRANVSNNAPSGTGAVQSPNNVAGEVKPPSSGNAQMTIPAANAPVQQMPTGNVRVPQAPTGNVSMPQTPSGTAVSQQNVNMQNNNEQEKQMSMYYLLRHYSKENKQIYKQQKEAKKEASAKQNKTNNTNNTTPNAVPGQPNNTVVPQQNAGMNIPGKQNGAAVPQQNAGMNIPGKQNSVAVPQQNAGMNIPGKQNGAAVPQQTAGMNIPGKQNSVAVPQQTAGMNIPGKQNSVTAPQQNAGMNIPGRQDNAAIPQPSMGMNAMNGNWGPDMVTTSVQNFGETTVLGNSAGIGETTVLGQASANIMPSPHLMRTKNNEKIAIDKPIFRMGKERSYVDYFIGDNTAVSRSHANIVSKDGEYFIVDTNSTNHTYVNGSMIQSNVEVKLSHGSKIMLANEEFEFHAY